MIIQSCAISVFLILQAFIQPQIASAQIPSSQRSKKAIQKVKPELEKALQAQSLKLGSPIFAFSRHQTNSKSGCKHRKRISSSAPTKSVISPASPVQN